MKLTPGQKYQVVHRISGRARAKDRLFVGVFLLHRDEGISLFSLRPKLGTIGIRDVTILTVATVPDSEPIKWDVKVDRYEPPF